MLRGYAARLTALYTGLFALSVAILGAVTLFAARAALERQFEDRIRTESDALVREFQAEGLTGATDAVRERDAMPGALDYGFSGPGGVVAGRLAGATRSPGWSVLQLATRSGKPEADRVFTTDLPGGYRLQVGDDLDRTEALDGAIVEAFAFGFVAILALGALGGYGLSRGIGGRMAAITGTAEAIIDGDLTRRVPVQGVGDDLEGLALTFNRMLDRIAVLMESLRQMSNDIAHDLRTPLTRLRNRLEAGLASPESDRTALLEAALVDLDAILTTFAALLRIAQIEAGARRAGFRQVDLAAVARNVVEAFAPSAEEGGRRLLLAGASEAVVEGDAELLTQMLVNLVENGLNHTPPGSTVEVAVQASPNAALCVADDGPGVPENERARVLERFYRLEESRSTPGAGLGLALALAIARLHQTGLKLSDAAPGLRVDVVFPGRP